MFDSVLITLVDKPRSKSGVRHALEEFGLDLFVDNLTHELSIKEITGSVFVFQKDVLVQSNAVAGIAEAAKPPDCDLVN